MSLPRIRQPWPYLLPVTLGLAATSPDTLAAAPEYLIDERPVPASVEHEPAPMEEIYPEESWLPSAFPRLRECLRTAAPFWRDTQLNLNPRMYYFDCSRENANNSEALAYGGWLAWNTGLWRDRLK